MTQKLTNSFSPSRTNQPPFGVILCELSHLSHLTELHLEVSLSQLELESNESLLQLSKPLNSVKRLHLSIYGYPTEQSFALIPRICPQVCEIYIKFHYRVLPYELLHEHFYFRSLPRLQKAVIYRYDEIKDRCTTFGINRYH